MEMISYQYADPKDIDNLKDEQFAKLVKNKIYAINPQFANSQSCMERLIEHLTSLPIGKDTLKLIRDLVKYFQAPILYCLKEFYSRNEKNFKELVSHQNQESSTNSTKKALKILQEIGSITVKLTSGMQQIEELDFLTKYGLSNKDIDLEIKEQKYQKSFLIWLKKSLIGLRVMINQTISEKARANWIQRTQKQFAELVGNRTSVELEKFVLSEIIMQSEDKPNFHKKQNLNDFTENQKRSLSKNKREFIANQPLDLRTISPFQRRYFFQNQNLSHAEDINLQYKNFKAPYDKYSVQHLRRAICAFLNRAGGVIFVGIKEDLNNKSRIVKGQILSEYKKQQVLKEYKYICAEIRPDIISQGKFRIRFVPIKDRNNKYIQGKYIVRVQITKGDERSFYTVNEDDEDFVMLRTDNQVLRRGITQKTLANFKMRIFQPTRHPPLQPCAQPDVGIPLLEDKYVTKYNQKHQNNRKQDDDLSGCYNNPNFGNKQKWKLKTQPVSPPTKQIKPKDFVYMNVKRESYNGNLEQEQGIKSQNMVKRKGFFCDEEDEDECDVEEKKEIQEKQTQKKSKVKENANDDILDFIPINPIVVKKQSYQPVSKKYPVKQNNNNYQPYKVDRTPSSKPIQKPPSIDLLVIGLTYTKVHQLTINLDLELTEPPINCNDDLVTWVSIKLEKGIQTVDKIKQFMELLFYEWKKIPDSPNKKHIKVRKLFSNVYFKDEILLNKFVNKFGHDEEFEDEKGVYYYKCKDRQQAIEAYMIGYNQNIKIKFISNEQLKEKKLQHLRYKVERRESQRNNRLSQQFLD